MIGRMFHVTISYARSYLLDPDVEAMPLNASIKNIHETFPRFQNISNIVSSLSSPKDYYYFSSKKGKKRTNSFSPHFYIEGTKNIEIAAQSHSLAQCNHSYVTIIMNPIQREEKEREMGKAYFNELLLLKAEKFPSSSRIRL